jgi:hypothetical protein
LLHLSNILNQAVTTYNESKGKNKMALLPMTHFVDKYRNTDQQSDLLNGVNRVQHGECVEMFNTRRPYSLGLQVYHAACSDD